MVFTTTFNIISVISWWRKLEKTTDLTQVADKEKGALVYQVLIHVLFIGNTLVWHLNLHSFMSYVVFFSSPCQRQCELLPSLGVRRPLNFHIFIFYPLKPLSQMN